MRYSSALVIVSMVTLASSVTAAPRAPGARHGSSVPPGGKPTERRLHSDSVEASSFLWNDWNRFQENYHPNYALDDDPRTAWVEGSTGTGAGEWLRVRVTRLDGVSSVRLQLRNGYHKSKPLFAANARIRDVSVVLQPSGRTVKATLTDAMSWQELVVPQDAGPLEAVELRVGTSTPVTRSRARTATPASRRRR